MLGKHRQSRVPCAAQWGTQAVTFASPGSRRACQNGSLAVSIRRLSRLPAGSHQAACRASLYTSTSLGKIGGSASRICGLDRGGDDRADARDRPLWARSAGTSEGGATRGTVFPGRPARTHSATGTSVWLRRTGSAAFTGKFRPRHCARRRVRPAGSFRIAGRPSKSASAAEHAFAARGCGVAR